MGTNVGAPASVLPPVRRIFFRFSNEHHRDGGTPRFRYRGYPAHAISALRMLLTFTAMRGARRTRQEGPGRWAGRL